MIAVLRRDAEDGTGTRALINVGQIDWAIGAFAAGKGHIPILIRAALLQRLLMTVARLHDTGSDVDSLPNVFRLLEDREVATGVLVDSNFQPPMDAARAQWAVIGGDPRAKRVWLFRTRVLAHSISSKSDFERPEWDDVMTLSQDTFAVVEALGVASGLAPALLKYTYNAYVDRATEYWSRLAGRQSPIREI